MFAGVKDGGADLAWLSTALNQEEANQALAAYLFGLLDIWKCFDQILPLLVRVLAGLAGMPTPILWAYTRIMAELKAVNCLSTGVGKDYTRVCSIPQGCPWSMMLLALMTYPWITMIKREYKVIPRALADDLSLWATEMAAGRDEGDDGWQQRWREAMAATLDFLVDMGAKPEQEPDAGLNPTTAQVAAQAAVGSRPNIHTNNR